MTVQKILNGMVSGSPKTYSVVTSFRNVILIFTVILRNIYSLPYEHIAFSEFTCRQTSLGTIRFQLCLLYSCFHPVNHHIVDQKLVCPIQFQLL
jgi:hypothetical protein